MSNFSQLCVWPGTIITKNVGEIPDGKDIKNFESFMTKQFGVTVKYEKTVTTLPDRNDQGQDIEGTGGRCDLFFYIAEEDISKFAVPRLQYGIRWWEDVLYNGNGEVYPQEFIESHPKMW